ncbi:hypothetical protein MPNT_50167 [Candidatus Methylacidithermus pantelleriae]|uniref:Uncharacterized protein n=1 Tax=Candidatus Methylacidithermus pantelleriae TaxID=2744239 RepID=A0A8J2BV17_9BACT|nr:hypothetical protein MPNT_50167 [Candidatus Methylacidithermus pantelleriae]
MLVDWYGTDERVLVAAWIGAEMWAPHETPRVLTHCCVVEPFLLGVVVQRRAFFREFKKTNREKTLAW